MGMEARVEGCITLQHLKKICIAYNS